MAACVRVVKRSGFGALAIVCVCVATLHLARPCDAVMLAGSFLHGSFEGRVLDQGTGEPLARADVALVSTCFAGTSDKRGRFRIDVVPAGSSRIKISCSGYLTYYTVVRIEPNRAQSVEVKLLKAKEVHAVRYSSVVPPER